MPWRRAAVIASSIDVRRWSRERPAKMPPVWNQRTPSVAEEVLPVDVARPQLEAAVWPRSDTPTAPRTPKPRSVKLSPLRTVRPMPSYGTHRMSDVSTPPCRMKSSTSRPTSLSANAVTTAVRSPKQRRSPRATLYSPPPSQTPERAGGADAPLARVEAEHDLAERDQVVAALLGGADLEDAHARPPAMRRASAVSRSTSSSRQPPAAAARPSSCRRPRAT